MSEIDELLTKPCWIIDILPEQVPGNGPGQFFAIEKAFLHDPDLRRKQADLLLKLNCYYDLMLVRDEEEIRNPAPEKLAELIGREYLIILIGDALISADNTNTYMALFGPDEKLLELIRKLAAAEGLFVWKGYDT